MEAFKELIAMQKRMQNEVWENQKMQMTQEDWNKFYNADTCYMCHESFPKKKNKDGKVVADKHRDHDHYTGEFRGAACRKCNLQHRPDDYLVVVVHNLKGYDSHFFVHEAARLAKELDMQNDISAIPLSNEKFMSFTFGHLKFIDSYQFRGASLEKLVENLYDKDDKHKHFHNMRQFFPNDMDILCRKGYYPYEWVDSFDKLNYVGLPPIEAFSSQLTRETRTPEEYEHALKVYARLKCESFKDYHLAYLKTDVLLLADVFTRFRETCLDYYELDPANYLSAPGLAWDAMLKMTKVELDLISDPEMFNMMDRMKRGGLCFVGSMRHVKANNKYLEDFDPSKPSTYIMYWDANNLYGWAMIQPLPYSGLEFDTKTTLEQILDTADDHNYGYNVEVDFHFPIDTHDRLMQFPPAPENLTPDIEWFSEFQRRLGEEKEIIRNGKYHGSNKLVPHLFEHKNYVIHYRNLKYLVKLGAVITKVHRVLKFKQKAWLKPYIDFNTQKRAEAKNDFEKDFFKLMNNAVFGNSCEDVKIGSNCILAPMTRT